MPACCMHRAFKDDIERHGGWTAEVCATHYLPHFVPPILQAMAGVVGVPYIELKSHKHFYFSERWQYELNKAEAS